MFDSSIFYSYLFRNSFNYSGFTSSVNFGSFHNYFKLDSTILQQTDYFNLSTMTLF